MRTCLWDSVGNPSKLQDSLLCQTAPSKAPSKGFQCLEPAGCILWHFSSMLGCEARFGCHKIQGLGIFGLKNHEKKCQERIPGPQKDVNCKNVANKNCNDLNEALQSWLSILSWFDNVWYTYFSCTPQLLDVNPYMAAMSESFHLLSGQMPQSMTNFAIQLLDIWPCLTKTGPNLLERRNVMIGYLWWYQHLYLLVTDNFIYYIYLHMLYHMCNMYVMYMMYIYTST